MAAENLQQTGEFGRLGKPEPGLDGEAAGNGFAQATKQAVQRLRVAQHATARVLATHDGGRAAEVEVDPAYRIDGQPGGAADQARQVVADDLGEYRTPGVVFGDGPQEVAVEGGSGVDAEVSGDEPIGQAPAGQHADEGQVGDVLHGGEHEGGAVGWEQIAHGQRAGGAGTLQQ